ncbi:hypothetical protein OC835_002153 [Tilletia horrida]|nr:hypothetical protein OC835_002153 [Tilletia horrida]
MGASSLPRYSQVIVLGAGISGIATAALLQREFGIHDVRIFERYNEPGGVWFINKYPGAGCDIPYSFEQRNNWSKAWSERDELLAYYQSVFHKYNLGPRTSFQTEAVACKFDVSTNLWHVWTRKAAQPEHDARKDSRPAPVSDDLSRYDHWVCRVLFNCVGSLSEPNKCNIEGAELFEGPIFHSARWDPTVDLTDKRVILVGNGCSGSQILERCISASKVKHITQLGRSKHHYLPMPNILDTFYSKFLRRFLPNLLRTIIFFYLEVMFRAFRITGGRRARATAAAHSRHHITKTAPKEYHDILIPDPQKLPIGCKRRVFDFGYLKALNANNADLKAANVKRITANSVVLDTGEELPADAIVLATGFSLTDTGGTLQIFGRDGREMKQYMREEFREPTTYRSVQMASFPNLFNIMSGTHNGTGHSSVVFTAECQIEWSFRVARDIFNDRRRPAEEELTFSRQDDATRAKYPTVEPKKEAQIKEMLCMQENMQKYVFSSRCGSWYEDKATGAIAAMYAGSQVDFWRRSHWPVFSDLAYSNLPERASPTRTWSERIGGLLRLGDFGEPKTTIHRKMDGGRIIDPGFSGSKA